MDDLVLVSKNNRAAGLTGTRTGRPTRTSFGLRRYADAYTLAIPMNVCSDGDKIDFFLSSSGFAVRLGPDGERAISGKRTARTATIPKEVAQKLTEVPQGATDLAVDVGPDNLHFFPFSQF